jgi:hypothetical protein
MKDSMKSLGHSAVAARMKEFALHTSHNGPILPRRHHQPFWLVRGSWRSWLAAQMS